MKRLVLVALPGDEGERLDRFIAARGAISRGAARRAIDEGGVFLDGRRCKVAGKPIRAGYTVHVNLEEGGRVPDAVEPLGPERLLFSDPHLLAVDKPAGVPAQATLTSDRGTLPELAAALIGAPLTLVHRLDRETSGVTVLGRSADATAALAEAFRAGGPEKTWAASHTPRRSPMRTPSPRASSPICSPHSSPPPFGVARSWHATRS